MARPREPISLIEAKGKKHLTKAEIEGRKQTEVQTENDKITAPSYLNTLQKREFKKISDELIRIKIMSNFDCDALARYIKARDKYIKYSNMLEDMPEDLSMIMVIEKLDNMQDKAFKQCNAAARELGLTISSRCKLVVPKTEEKKPESKFAKFGVASG